VQRIVNAYKEQGERQQARREATGEGGAA
jgi:hypothetical protein